MEDRIETPASPMPRMVAILLAFGGLGWGLFLFAAFGISALLPLPFGVGYLITIGYIVRTVFTPSFVVRRILWVTSILVQRGWLIWILTEMVRASIMHGHFEIKSQFEMACVFWWTFATIGSILALVNEPRFRVHRHS
jgi:hypothetical protein